MIDAVTSINYNKKTFFSNTKFKITNCIYTSVQMVLKKNIFIFYLTDNTYLL